MVALMNSVPFKRFHSPPTVCRVCFRLYMNTVFRCRGTKTWHDKGVSVLPVWCLADNQTASETLRHQGWWAAFQNQPSENHAHFTQGLARSVEVRSDLFFFLNATTFVCSCVLSATPICMIQSHLTPHYDDRLFISPLSVAIQNRNTYASGSLWTTPRTNLFVWSILSP